MLGAALMIPIFATSCTTTYDAYGYPRQSVDPGTAAAGVVAAGLIGYALANDNDGHHRGHRYHRSGGNYYGGGYGGYNRYSGYRGGYGDSCYY